MKKLSITLALVALFTFGTSFQSLVAQETAVDSADTTDVVAVEEVAETAAVETIEEAPEEDQSGHKILLEKFYILYK